MFSVESGVAMNATAIERLRGRLVVLSVSGGKDSAATSLHLREHGIEHLRVFADTGWEHPMTYEYLRGELTRVIGPIIEVKSQWTLPELVRKKGMFPSRQRRFCTQELKVKPLATYVRSLNDDVVNAVGVRAAESESRARLSEWEWSDTFDCDVWRPILQWSENDVIDIHRRHGLRPNPLYLLGAERVGCWPCIHARKAEIRLISESDPARIDEIRRLEAEAHQMAEARYAARGETFASLGYMRPTFFQAPLGEMCPKCKGQNEACEKCAGTGSIRPMWPIDKVVTWSKTSRGGRQLEIFADHTDGCVRWGMCESVTK